MSSPTVICLFCPRVHLQHIIYKHGKPFNVSRLLKSKFGGLPFNGTRHSIEKKIFSFPPSSFPHTTYKINIREKKDVQQEAQTYYKIQPDIRMKING